MALNGIPIFDTQNMGDSLPSINNSLTSLDARYESLTGAQGLVNARIETARHNPIIAGVLTVNATASSISFGNPVGAFSTNGQELGSGFTNGPYFGRTYLKEPLVEVDETTFGTSVNPAYVASWNACDISSDGKWIVAVTSLSGGNSRAVVSNNYGKTFRQNSIGFGYTLDGVATSSDGRFMLATSSFGYIMRSTDYGATWNFILGLGYWTSPAISTDGRVQVVAVTNTYGIYNGIYVSRNYGTTWTQVYNISTSFKAVRISSDGSVIYAVASGGAEWTFGRVYVSRDFGATWSSVLLSNSNFYNYSDISISSDGRTVAVCVEFYTTYISTNYGLSYSFATPPHAAAASSLALSPDGEMLIVGGKGTGGLYIAPTIQSNMANSQPISWIQVSTTNFPTSLRYNAGTIKISNDGKIIVATPRNASNLENRAIVSYSTTIFKPGSVIADGNLSVSGAISSTGNIFTNGSIFANANLNVSAINATEMSVVGNVSASAFTGIHYGDGSRLSGINLSQYFTVSGGEVFGSVAVREDTPIDQIRDGKTALSVEQWTTAKFGTTGNRTITTDINGIIYFIDQQNDTVKRIDPTTGIVTTLFGYPSTSISMIDGGFGVAKISGISNSIAADNTGRYLYMTDYACVRRIDLLTSTVSTIAGSVQGFWGSTNGIGTAARFFYAYGIAVNSAGTMAYITDETRVRSLDLTTYSVSAVAGLYGVAGLSAAPHHYNTRLTTVGGITINENANCIYVADGNTNTILRVNLTYPHAATFVAGVTSLSMTTAERNAPTRNGSLGINRTFNPVTLSYDGKDLLYWGSGSTTSGGGVNVVSLSTGSVTKLSLSSQATFSDNLLSAAQVGAVYALSNPVQNKINFVDYGSASGATGIVVRQLDLPTTRVTTIAGNSQSNSRQSGNENQLLITVANIELSGTTVPALFTRSIAPTSTAAELSITSTGISNIGTISNIGNINTSGTLTSNSFFTNIATVPVDEAYIINDDYTTLTSDSSLAIDNYGNVYVTNARRTFKLSPNGHVVTVVSEDSWNSLSDGAWAQSTIVDPHGNTIYILGHHTTNSIYNNIYKFVLTKTGTTATTVISQLPPFNFPPEIGCNGGCMDLLGNFYVASDWLHVIYRVTAAGEISIFAGSATYLDTPGYVDGTGTAARFNGPRDIVYDPINDCLYVADQNNHRIRRITCSGAVVSTYAGTSFAGSNVEVPRLQASFNTPRRLTIDREGNLYVVQGSSVIVITARGFCRTYFSGSHEIQAIVYDNLNGGLWFLDSSDRGLWRYNGANEYYKVTGVVAFNSRRDGIISSMGGYSNKSVYLNKQRQLENTKATGVLSPYGTREVFNSFASIRAETVSGRFEGDAVIDNLMTVSPKPSTALLAKFGIQPKGIAVVPTEDTILVSDTENNQIRRILPNRAVDTFIGNPYGVSGMANGVGTSVELDGPTGITLDTTLSPIVGYVSDSNNNTIRRFTYPHAVCSSIFSNNNSGGLGDAMTLNFTAADNIIGSAYDPNTGYTYVAAYAQNRIFAINPAGGVYLIAGTGTAATTDAAINRGNALRANINGPHALAIDSTGDYLYIAESASHKILRLTLRPNRPGREAEVYGYQIPGDLVTIVGSGTAGSADSTTGTSATLTNPRYMVIDNANKYLYFAESHKIRRIDLSSPSALSPLFPVVTIVGTGTAGVTDSIHGTQALCNTAGGITLSPDQRYLYFTDAGGNKIRRVDLGARSNPVITIAGTGAAGTADSNYGLSAAFSGPYGLYYAYDEPSKGSVSPISEQLLVADYTNHRIRSIKVNNPNITFDASSVTQKAVALSGSTLNLVPSFHLTPKYSPISLYNPLWFVNLPAAAVNYFTHHVHDRFAQGDNILFFGQSAFTVESWVYFLAAPTNAAPQVLASVRTMTPLSGLAVRFEVGDQLTVRLGVSAYNSGVAHGMAINTWNHVCYMRTYDNGPLEFYVNGVLRGTNPFTATGWISGNLFVYPSQLGWILDQGERNASCIGSDFGTASMQGYMSQFRTTYATAVYNTGVKRFSPQKYDFTGWTGDPSLDYANDKESYTGGATPHYQAYDPNYYVRTLMFTTSAVGEMSPGYASTGGYPRVWTKTGTSGNMIQSTPAAGNPHTAAGNMGVYFDGTFFFGGENAAFSMGTGNFTIETWVYPTNYPPNSWTPIIVIGSTEYQTPAKQIRLSHNIDNNGFGFLVPNNTGDGDLYYSRGEGLALQEWHHLALVRNGSNITLFRNGVPEVSATGFSFNHGATSNSLRIGINPQWDDGGFLGILSQVRITKGKALYTSSFTLPSMYGAGSLLTPTTNGAATGAGSVAPVLGDVVYLGLQNVGYPVTTVGGTGVAGATDGNTGIAGQVSFNGPIHFNLIKYGSGSNSTKTLSLVDYRGSRIRQLETTNNGSTYNVTTLYNPSNLHGAPAFRNPHGLFFQNTNEIYVADKNNHGIKRVNPNTGEAMTVAGALDGGAGYVNFCNLGKFYNQHGLARDNTNNILYVADRGNHTIRAITIDSVVTTIAGAPGVAGFADGIGPAARFNDPVGIAINAAGTELYVADAGNHCIRRIITATRAVSTVAGQPGVAGQLSLSAVPGYNALFDGPWNIVADATTNLYVSNSNSHTIYKVALAANGTQPAGTVSFMAGNSAVAEAGAQDGIRSFARFNNPFGMVISGNSLFIADISNHTVRKLDIPTYTVTTLAGQPGIAGFTDAATGGSTQFNRPHSLIVDNAATPALYVCDRDNNAIRRVLTTTGQTSTVHANTYQHNIFTYFNPNLGTTEGVALSTAYYEAPTCIAGNAAGTEIYMSVPGWHLISVLSATALPQRIVKQFAGGYVESGTTDTPSNSAILMMQHSQRLRSPSKVVNTTTGLGYICDTENHTIRRINYTTGRIDNFAGNGTAGFADHYGVGARFNNPTDIVIQSNGDLIVADTGNRRLRKITPAGLVTTIAGSAVNAAGIDIDGALTVAGVSPLALWTDSTNLTFTENESSKVKRWFGGTNTINTIAGSRSAGSSNSPAALYPLTKNYVQLPTPASGFVALDLTQAYMFRVLMNAATITFAFNFPRVSKIHDFMIQTVGDGTVRSVVWPSNVKWGTAFSTTRGTAPSVSSGAGIIDTFEFITYDGGITWFGRGFQQQG